MAESFGFYRSAMTRLGEKAEAVATLQGAQVGDPPPIFFSLSFSITIDDLPRQARDNHKTKAFEKGVSRTHSGRLPS
jgi:hypothetical protein